MKNGLKKAWYVYPGKDRGEIYIFKYFMVVTEGVVDPESRTRIRKEVVLEISKCTSIWQWNILSCAVVVGAEQ